MDTQTYAKLNNRTSKVVDYSLFEFHCNYIQPLFCRVKKV